MIKLMFMQLACLLSSGENTCFSNRTFSYTLISRRDLVGDVEVNVAGRCRVNGRDLLLTVADVVHCEGCNIAVNPGGAKRLFEGCSFRGGEGGNWLVDERKLDI